MTPIELRDMLNEVIDAELVDLESDIGIHIFAGEENETFVDAHRFEIEMLPNETRRLYIGTQ